MRQAFKECYHVLDHYHRNSEWLSHYSLGSGTALSRRHSGTSGAAGLREGDNKAIGGNHL
jgi:hypothetical protein